MKDLFTDRLILRKVTINDLDDLFNNWGSDINTTKFLTFKTHSSKEDTMKFINNWINKYEKGGLEWAIELKENYQVIGMISADKSYKYKCNIIEAIIPSNNIGSIRVAEKCGLTLEATIKNRYKDKDDIVQDLCVYSIIK